MFRFTKDATYAVVAAFFLLHGLALAQSTAASVSIDTTQSTPLNPGYAGFNSPQARYSVEDYDVNFQKLAATLSPGWLRYPGGTVSEAFNWATGELVQDWVNNPGIEQDASSNQSCLEINFGKGGEHFNDFAGLAAACNAKIVICLNGFTDTPASAGAFAQYTKDHNVPIAVWELSNEAYLYPAAWASGADYAAAMKSYRDAIKAVLPNAIVSIFFYGANGSASTAWNKSLAQYSNKYWDAVSFHHYPANSSLNTFSSLIPYANNDLATNSTSTIDSLNAMNPAGMKYVISEYGAYKGGNATLYDSVYGGVEVAEYLLRMSSRTEILYAGMHELYASPGIIPTNSHNADTEAAYKAGKTIDTSQFHDFDWYISSEILGASVVNGALAHATASVATTLTGGSTVLSHGTPATIPAMYAQAYQDAAKNTYLLITNKDSQNETVQIAVNGAAAKGSYAMTFLSSTDPTATNTATSPTAVKVQTQTVTSPVTIPPYSVVRLDLGGGAAARGNRPFHRGR
jgi:alpha-L-arabinofuranosidase